MNLKPISKNQRAVMAAILLLALALRLWAVAACRFIGTDGGVDGVVLLTAGRNLWSGAGFSFQGRPETIHAPLFPILAGLLWKVTGDLELAGLLISALSGVVAVGAVYALARRLYGRPAALYAAALTAVFPPLIYGATEVRVDPLYASLYLLIAVVLWDTAARPGLLRGLLAGGVVGLTYLTRPEGMVFLPLGAALILARAGRLWKVRFGRLLAALAGMLLVFSLLAGPYVSFLHRHLGVRTLSARSPFTFIPYFAEDWEKANFQAYAYPERIRAEWTRRGGMGWILREKGDEMARRLLHNFGVLFRIGRSEEILRMGLPPLPVSLAFALAVLALLGLLAKKIRDRRWGYRESYILVLCLPLAPYFFLTDFLTSQKLRYGYPYLFWLLIIGGTLAARPVSKRIWRWAGSAGLVLCLALSLWLIPGKAARVPYEYKLLGLWMREHLEGVGEATVMSQRLGVAFYAGARHVQTYPGTWPEILDYARETGADYLMVNDWTTPRLRPGAAFLLEDLPAPPGLEPVHTVRYRGRRARLYRFHLDED